MKTSNKLLVGFLVFVVIGIIAVKLIFKHPVNSQTKIQTEIKTDTQTNDSVSDSSDSIAMEKAINNE